MERIAVLCAGLLMILTCDPRSEALASAITPDFNAQESGKMYRQWIATPSPPNVERQQLEAFMDLIDETPWAIVEANGKRYDMNFVPRLGRDATADTSLQRHVQEPSDFTGEVVVQRSPPFAPRLGKRLQNFSPRLGRKSHFQFDGV